MSASLTQATQKPVSILVGFSLLLSTCASPAFGAPVPVRQNVQSDPTAQIRCDLLANAPNDTAKVGAGIALEKIDAEEAVPACQDAVRQSATPHNQFLYGRALEAAQRYPEALEQFRSSAGAGYAAAINSIGWMYLYGQGFQKSEADAAAWFRKAAEAGDLDGMNDYGVMLLHGMGGVNLNPTEAVTWFRKAADAGDAYAMYNLGATYEKEIGVPKNYPEAARWYRKGAEAGNAMAMDCLGYMYAQGHGVPQNDAEAVRWYKLAADLGEPSAQSNLAYMLASGRGGTISITDAGATCLKAAQAAQAGSGPAMNILGWMYAEGHACPQDYEKAAEWFSKAAQAGVTAATNNLAVLYALGKVANHSSADAIPLFHQAADAGSIDAMDELGIVYMTGHSVHKDYKESMAWFQKAADNGDALGMYNLGVMYNDGFGVKKDSTTAAKWYRGAANQGFAPAQLNLGFLLQHGLGVQESLSEATALYAKAATSNVPWVSQTALRLKQSIPGSQPTVYYQPYGNPPTGNVSQEGIRDEIHAMIENYGNPPTGNVRQGPSFGEVFAALGIIGELVFAYGASKGGATGSSQEGETSWQRQQRVNREYCQVSPSTVLVASGYFCPPF